MPLDGKIQRYHRKRVCAKDVTTLFSRFILSRFKFAAHLGAFSQGDERCHTRKYIIGRKADKTAFSTKLIEIYLPNNGLHGIMENA